MATVKHIKSTEGACFQEGAVGSFRYEDTLELTGARKQAIKGFGGCFNELGWQAIGLLSEQDRKAFLDELFLEENCGFNYGRIPIGANDFSLEWYSCDETRDDYELKDFNIDRDREYTIPFVREAAARQKDFWLFASPWSPPTWMKTKPVYNFGTMRMEEKVLQAYARYFAKFVEAYRAEGLSIRQVHVQNEPMADQKFPSCKWTGPDMRDFIRDYLGPVFEEQGLDTEIWLGTINGPFVDILLGPQTVFSEFYDQFINTILSDKKAREYISGVGLQWGGKHVLEHIEAAWPEMRILQTESECGDGRNAWESMEYIFTLMWQYFRHGAEGYTYWNMALQSGGVSSWGWAQNSLGVVDPETKVLTYSPEFYLMKHFSHFVKPGAVYLDVKGRFAANAVAFENPDGSIVIVLGNNMHTAREFTFSCGEKSFSAEIEPHSVHTFVIEN